MLASVASCRALRRVRWVKTWSECRLRGGGVTDWLTVSVGLLISTLHCHVIDRSLSVRRAPYSYDTQYHSASCTVHTPGYVPKKTRWVFWGYTHIKKTTPKNPHFYFNLILVYTLYATNNAIFYCFKAFKALSYWVFVLFTYFFLLVQKPNKTQNPIKPQKTHWVGLFLKPGFFERWHHENSFLLNNSRPAKTKLQLGYFDLV